MRRGLAAVLAGLGCLLAVAGLLAVWARAEVLDTDRYVESVRPLAGDPVIQGEVADRVTTVLMQRVDLSRLSLPAQVIVRQAVRRQTVAFLDSPAFEALWLRTNRTLHEQLVRVLRDDDASVSATDGLVLDLTPVANAVRRRLEAVAPSGLGQLPRVTLRVQVADAEQIRRARAAVVWLDRLAVVLPVATVALLVGAVLLARRRLRALALVLLGLAVAMLATRLLLAAGRTLAEARTPPRIASDAAVAAFYQDVTALLRHGADLIGLVAVAGGLLLLVAAAVARRRSGTDLERPSPVG